MAQTSYSPGVYLASRGLAVLGIGAVPGRHLFLILIPNDKTKPQWKQSCQKNPSIGGFTLGAHNSGGSKKNSGRDRLVTKINETADYAAARRQKERRSL